MKNRYLQTALAASVLAVLVGVFTFSLNVVYGAPAVEPPATDIAPTFTGLNVEGPTKIEGYLEVVDNIPGSLDPSQTHHAELYYNFDGVTSNTGIGLAPHPILAVPVKTIEYSSDGTYTPVGTVWLSSLDLRSTPLTASTGNVTVDDTLEVTGDTVVDGKVRSTGGFGTVYRTYESVNISPGFADSVYPSCLTGEILLGCEFKTNSNDVSPSLSYVASGYEFCSIGAKNTTGGTVNLVGDAVCLDPDS